jgi:hypothetical protein
MSIQIFTKGLLLYYISFEIILYKLSTFSQMRLNLYRLFYWGSVVELLWNCCGTGHNVQEKSINQFVI